MTVQAKLTDIGSSEDRLTLDLDHVPIGLRALIGSQIRILPVPKIDLSDGGINLDRLTKLMDHSEVPQDLFKAQDLIKHLAQHGIYIEQMLQEILYSVEKRTFNLDREQAIRNRDQVIANLGQKLSDTASKLNAIEAEKEMMFRRAVVAERKLHQYKEDYERSTESYSLLSAENKRLRVQCITKETATDIRHQARPSPDPVPSPEQALDTQGQTYTKIGLPLVVLSLLDHRFGTTNAWSLKVSSDLGRALYPYIATATLKQDTPRRLGIPLVVEQSGFTEESAMLNLINAFMDWK